MKMAELGRVPFARTMSFQNSNHESENYHRLFSHEMDRGKEIQGRKYREEKRR